MIASAWTVASEHILSFGLGVFSGFIGSSRYRLVKRKDE